MTFDITRFMEKVVSKNAGEVEFHQAVREVIESLAPYLKENPTWLEDKLLERLVEPERVITFRVPWIDDEDTVQINRGWRVEFNSAIGPYKGGLRFSPHVTLGTLKFLAFEQIFKNSLTSLPLGGGKGGADFDSTGKSDREIMRFCQSYMTELYRHIGEHTDIPAGDLGVNKREIGYLFGQYKKITNEFTGVLTGKGMEWGGSYFRPEATGYGVAYFLDNMLRKAGSELKGKRVSVSGYGNVGSFLIEKITELGGTVVTISDKKGYVYDEQGIRGDKIEFVKNLWCRDHLPVEAYAKRYNLPYILGRKPWEVAVDIAIPSACQNELTEEDAKQLLSNGIICVCEASNMPVTKEAFDLLKQHDILFGPAKAANAGGVAVSGLEMTQNSLRYSWKPIEVDQELKQIMRNIHDKCVEFGTVDNKIDYAVGANIAGFLKVAQAMRDQGIV